MKINIQTRRRGADPTMPRLLGDRLCLDFVNTVESPRSDPEEYLFAYPDLARWGRHVNILNDGQVERLLREAERHPDDAGNVFDRAIDLRGAITRIFQAVAAKSEPSRTDLNLLQTEYVSALDQAHLSASEHAFDWIWPDVDALDRMLWDVARSAVKVLTQDDLKRVKQCPGAGDCGWLFYDTSKNASRRWCSMEGCGSRVKMRRQYTKKHGRHEGQS